MNEADKYEELTISRTLNASREAVWEAWTEPEKFAKWWSPELFEIPVCEMDVRPEGKLRIDMKGPDGTIYPSIGEYKEVNKPEKLSFLNSPLDKDGKKLFEVLQTIELKEDGDITVLNLTAKVTFAIPEAKPYLDGMEPGIKMALNKLDNLLK